MPSKSHFLLHFIPGMLLGAVVGLAFGSLLVVTQIPKQVSTGDEFVVAPEDVARSAGPLRYEIPEWGVVSVSMTQYPLANWLNEHFDAGIDLSIDWSKVDPDFSLPSNAERVADALIGLKTECAIAGESPDESELISVASSFVAAAAKGSNTQSVYRYEFAYTGSSQEPRAWTVYAVPNAPGFLTTNEFIAATNVCAVGGTYPMDAMGEWLTFESSCGSGYSDGSGLPNGCDEAKKAVKVWISE